MMIWKYDGTWTQIPYPEVLGSDDDPDHDRVALGFDGAVSEGWGSNDDPEIQVWSHATDRERWWVEWTIGASYIHTIDVHGLPNLIDLMSKLGTIALANLAGTLTYELNGLLEVAAEDGRREQRRRHPQPTGT